eukprot:6432306-Alexandrium_andersonii.AAC.1
MLPSEVAAGKWLDWHYSIAWDGGDIRAVHQETMDDGRWMPPPIVRQMGNNMDEVRVVLDEWR